MRAPGSVAPTWPHTQLVRQYGLHSLCCAFRPCDCFHNWQFVLLIPSPFSPVPPSSDGFLCGRGGSPTTACFSVLVYMLALKINRGLNCPLEKYGRENARIGYSSNLQRPWVQLLLMCNELPSNPEVSNNRSLLLMVPWGRCRSRSSALLRACRRWLSEVGVGCHNLEARRSWTSGVTRAHGSTWRWLFTGNSAGADQRPTRGFSGWPSPRTPHRAGPLARS